MRRRLSLQQKRARERMRLVEPWNAYKVVGHPRYWTPEFVELYLERCDVLQHDDPARAAQMAEHAPVLADRVRVDDGPSSYPHDAAKRAAVALARIVRDDALRRVGRDDLAAIDGLELDRLFRLGVPRRVAIERWRRAAGLAGADDPAAALALLNRAVRLAIDGGFEPTREAPPVAVVDSSAPGPSLAPSVGGALADALFDRGRLRHAVLESSALEDFGAVLVLADPASERGRRAIRGAVLALDRDLARHEPHSEPREAAFRMVRLAKRRFAHRPRSGVKMRLYWLEGLLLGTFGITRHAVRQLLKAWEGLLELERPFDLTMLALDLATAHRADDDDARAVAVPSRLRRALEGLEGDEARAVLEAVVPRFERASTSCGPANGESCRRLKLECWVRFGDQLARLIDGP